MKILQLLIAFFSFAFVGQEVAAIDGSPGFVYQKIIVNKYGHILIHVKDTTPQAEGFLPGWLILRTTNGGDTWVNSDGGYHDLDQISHIAALQGTVYAETYPHRTYLISDDFGGHWFPDSSSKVRDLRILEYRTPGVEFTRDERNQLYEVKSFSELVSKYKKEGSRALENWMIAASDKHLFVLNDSKLLRAQKGKDRWEEISTNIQRYPYFYSFHATSKGILYFSASQNPLANFSSEPNRSLVFVKTSDSPNWRVEEFGLPAGIALRLIEVSGSRAYFRIINNAASVKHGIADQVFYSEDGSTITKLPFDDIDLLAPVSETLLYFSRKSSDAIFKCRRTVTNCEQIKGPSDLKFTRVRHAGI